MARGHLSNLRRQGKGPRPRTNGAKRGPLRRVVEAWNVGQFRMERLECGHEQQAVRDLMGYTNANHRRCHRCKKQKRLMRYWMGANTGELWATMEAAKLHGKDTFYRRHVHLFVADWMVGEVVRAFHRTYLFGYSNGEQLQHSAPHGWQVVEGLKACFELSRRPK